jgi:hypothetical protein
MGQGQLLAEWRAARVWPRRSVPLLPMHSLNAVTARSIPMTWCLAWNIGCPEVDFDGGAERNFG